MFSFASSQMNMDLGLSNTEYVTAAGIFLASYVLFGIPGSLMLKRLGGRTSLPFIVVLWGLTTGLMVFVTGTTVFYIQRFVAGALESVFFPITMYYLTQWVPEEDMGLNSTVVISTKLVTSLIVGPISVAILETMDGFLGIRGWRWLFFVECVGVITFGAFMFHILDGEPKDARFLDIEERTWLAIRQRKQSELRYYRYEVNRSLLAICSRWVLIVTAIYFLHSSCSNFIVFRLLFLIHPTGSSGSIVIRLLSAIPFIVSLFAMILVAYSSDRTQERRTHLALSAFVSCIGLFSASSIHLFFGNQVILLYLCLCTATVGVWCVLGPFWSIITAKLSGNMNVAAFAFFKIVESQGGVIGPLGFYESVDSRGAYGTSLVIFGLMMMFCGVLAMCLPENIAWHNTTLNNVRHPVTQLAS